MSIVEQEVGSRRRASTRPQGRRQPKQRQAEAATELPALVEGTIPAHIFPPARVVEECLDVSHGTFNVAQDTRSMRLKPSPAWHSAPAVRELQT